MYMGNLLKYRIQKYRIQNGQEAQDECPVPEASVITTGPWVSASFNVIVSSPIPD